MGSEAPPPMTPFCCRILIRGATESIAAVRYCMGDKGKMGAGGEDPRSGRAGLACGGGAVRSVSSITDMF
jgi:hypothetical protein